MEILSVTSEMKCIDGQTNMTSFLLKVVKREKDFRRNYMCQQDAVFSVMLSCLDVKVWCLMQSYASICQLCNIPR